HGNLRALGEGKTVIVGFRYGLDPALSGAANWTTGPASTSGRYASLVTDLTPNTTYFFEAWATGHGFTTGGIMSFTTMALPMPSGTKSSCERERRHDAARGRPLGPCTGGHILIPGPLDRIRCGIRHRGV